MLPAAVQKHSEMGGGWEQEGRLLGGGGGGGVHLLQLSPSDANDRGELGAGHGRR